MAQNSYDSVWKYVLKVPQISKNYIALRDHVNISIKPSAPSSHWQMFFSCMLYHLNYISGVQFKPLYRFIAAVCLAELNLFTVLSDYIAVLPLL